MNSIYEWLDKACRPLRYKPDREAAYKELKDHYEDHRLYLMDQGAYPAVAERQALEAMGDPAETGRMLSAAYHPVRTFLWRLSRWVLIMLAIVIAGACVRGFIRNPGGDWNIFKDPSTDILRTMEQRWAEDPNVTVTEGRCDGTAEIGDYRFTVIRALSVCAKDREYLGQVSNSVVLVLKAKGPLTLGQPEDIKYRLSASDDGLTLYNNVWSLAGEVTEGQAYVDPEYCYSSPGCHYFRVIIGDTAPDVKWMDLNYYHRQNKASLRVVFNEGAIQ